MHVLVQPRSYPAQFSVLFGPQQRDLGHEAVMMSAMADEWYSILVTDGSRALAHAIAPKPIGASGLCDVEPFMGYGGLLVNSSDVGFLKEALQAYSAACRDRKVIAEVIRFDPLLLNERNFINCPEVEIVSAKEVVIVPCEKDLTGQLTHFSHSRRSRLRRALAQYQARVLDKQTEISLFRNFYERSLVRIGAEAHWFLPERFYAVVSASSFFEIYSVWSGSDLSAAALVGHHPTGAHYILAAHSEEYPPGAGEYLIYEVARGSAVRGQRRLMLGGGNSDDADDALLRYKAQYAKGNKVTFFVGLMVHDRINFKRLQTHAAMIKPDIMQRKFFLKHRLIDQSEIGDNWITSSSYLESGCA